MRREVTWTEKSPDRTKREVSVRFFGGKLYWSERLSTEDRWNNELVPSEEDWRRLQEEVERRLQRGRARHEDLALVTSRAIGKQRKE